MNWKSAALLLLIAGLGACADGGSRGSGISTAQGNVDSVQMAGVRTAPRGPAEALLATLLDLLSIEKTAVARNPLEGIHVTVEGTDLASDTDPNGFFSLRGRFEGHAALVFERSADGILARLEINMPGGGTLTLNNVGIDQPSGQATAESQAVDFEGVVKTTDCSDQTLALVSRERSKTDTDVYTVDLTTSSLRDPEGNAVPCDNLRTGETLRVQGAVNTDGTFGGAAILIED